MVSIQIRFVFSVLVVLLLCSGADSNREFGGDSKRLPYQNELENIFDAFDTNHIQQMEEMLAFLEGQGADGVNDQTFNTENDPLRFVVSGICVIIKVDLKCTVYK